MPRATSLLVISIAFGLSGMGDAQTTPDFSGRWVVEPAAAAKPGAASPAAARGDMGSGWGPTIVITQNAKELVVESVVFSRYDLQPQPRFVYALDGSETRNTIMMGRGLPVQTSRARWDGQRLTIATVHPFDDPRSGKASTIDITQRIALESPTRLVVEVTRGGVLGGSPSTTRTVYTRSGPESQPRVQIRFEPESPTLERAVAEDDALWKAEGSRIVDAMECRVFHSRSATSGRSCSRGEPDRKGIYNYDSAWKWAMSMTARERAARFKSLSRK